MSRSKPSSLLLALSLTILASDVLAAEGRGKVRDLYLASRDEIKLVEKIIKDLPVGRGGSFVGIVGGMAALNFIERMEPTNILLVDLNPAQVEFGRCVVELVKLADNRHEFVAAFFSRPFVDDEEAFLSQPGDRDFLARNMGRIADRNLAASCSTDLALIADAQYDTKARALRVERNTNGRFVQRDGPDKGMPRGFNFLYYGRGWLRSDESFVSTRKALASAKLQFLASDIGAAPVDGLRGREVVFWGSNLATWFREGREAYERYVIRAHEELFARNQNIRFVFASTYRRTSWTDFRAFEQRGATVHLDASAKVKKFAQGRRVLELIPGRAYFGKELRASESTVQNASQPIEPNLEFDVAVLHILNNSGMKWWQTDRNTEFRALFDTVFERSGDVVILEHHRPSQDFSPRDRERMIGLHELLQPVFALLAKRRVVMELEPAVGEVDQRRNLVLRIHKP